MLRKLSFALLICAALVAAPTVAQAEGYVPPPPKATPTLAGSTVVPGCDGDVPYITYSVTLTDPDKQSTGHTARLILSDGTNSTTLTLGDLDASGKISGRILWPGASVAADGKADGWPGWMKVGSTWVRTSGNFAWTRSITSATISVNPTILVALSYPPASPDCVTDPPRTTTTSADDPAALSSTGVSEAIIPIGLAAVGVLVTGLVMLLPRRRRSVR